MRRFVAIRGVSLISDTAYNPGSCQSRIHGQPEFRAMEDDNNISLRLVYKMEMLAIRRLLAGVGQLYVTHLDETSHMSAEFVFRYGPKCMGGLILPILVLLHL